MKQETEAAALYWASCLERSKLNGQMQIDQFITQLQTFMQNKYANHWYVNNPLQGQAFRSLACDLRGGEIDQMLLDAAAASGFDITTVLDTKNSIRMWVDPGEVEVETGKSRIKLYPNEDTYSPKYEYEHFVDDALSYYPQTPYDSIQQSYYSTPIHYDQQYTNYYMSNTKQEIPHWNSYDQSYDMTTGVFSTA